MLYEVGIYNELTGINSMTVMTGAKHTNSCSICVRIQDYQKLTCFESGWSWQKFNAKDSWGTLVYGEQFMVI